MASRYPIDAKMDALGFGEWFYSSLLAQQSDLFVVAQLGGVRILNTDGIRFTRVDFLKRIASVTGTDNPAALQSALITRYGIDLETHKIATLLTAQSDEEDF